MNDDQRSAIVDILEREADMTIATVREDGYPQATTVSYVSDGLTIYFGTSSTSQKSSNLTLNNKVSLTVNSPYRFWKDINSLSISGLAMRVSGGSEFRDVEKSLHEKFPLVHEYFQLESENVFLFRIDPQFISHMDYRKGFGHVEKHVLRNTHDDR